MHLHGIATRSLKPILAFAGMLAASGAASSQVVNYTGTVNAGIAFGVTGYGGAPNNGAPTYIPNIATGRNDILASPAHGFLTANPVVANNIAGYGPAAFGPGQNMFAGQVGGGNINGAFGTGVVINFGNAIGASMTDSAPGGGSASYSITSWTANYTAPAVIPAGTTYGNVIAIGGVLPAVGSASVMSMATFISSPNAGDPFVGGVLLPQLVLAASGNGNFQAIGGAAGNVAAVSFLGPIYRGLAINAIPLLAPIPAGDVLNVTTTVTIYADPDTFDFFDPNPSLDSQLQALFQGLGSPAMPTLDLSSSSSAPEPGSLALLGLAGTGFAAWRRKKRPFVG